MNQHRYLGFIVIMMVSFVSTIAAVVDIHVDIVRRTQSEAFLGGWSLRQAACPAGTFACPRFEGMPACCPEGTECQQSYMTGHNYVACCPVGQSCEKTIHSLPVCANPEWVLYTHHTLYKSSFCCLSNQKAYVTTQSGNHPACGPDNLAVEASNVASTIWPATAVETGMKTATANTHTSTGRGSSESTSHSEQSEAGGGEKGSKSSVPIGAIVGGVVGGITVLGLIALGFFYVARKGRKQETETVGMGGGGYEEEVKSTEQGGLESWNGSEQTQMGRYQQAGYHFHGSEIDGQGVYSQRMEGAFQEMDGAGRR